MVRRLWSIVRKEFIQIVRDPRSLGITFVMPVVMMLLLGYAATTDVRNVPMAVFDQDPPALDHVARDGEHLFLIVLLVIDRHVRIRADPQVTLALQSEQASRRRAGDDGDLIKRVLATQIG